MARQGLMDDSGYDFLEPTDCSNFETCTEDAYQQGIADERPKAFANGYEKGYQQGRADVWADIEKIINNMSNPIQTMEIIIKQLKEQKK